MNSFLIKTKKDVDTSQDAKVKENQKTQPAKSNIKLFFTAPPQKSNGIRRSSDDNNSLNINIEGTVTAEKGQNNNAASSIDATTVDLSNFKDVKELHIDSGVTRPLHPMFLGSKASTQLSNQPSSSLGKTEEKDAKNKRKSSKVDLSDDQIASKTVSTKKKSTTMNDITNVLHHTEETDEKKKMKMKNTEKNMDNQSNNGKFSKKITEKRSMKSDSDFDSDPNSETELESEFIAEKKSTKKTKKNPMESFKPSTSSSKECSSELKNHKQDSREEVQCNKSSSLSQTQITKKNKLNATITPSPSSSSSSLSSSLSSPHTVINLDDDDISPKINKLPKIPKRLISPKKIKSCIESDSRKKVQSPRKRNIDSQKSRKEKINVSNNARDDDGDQGSSEDDGEEVKGKGTGKGEERRKKSVDGKIRHDTHLSGGENENEGENEGEGEIATNTNTNTLDLKGSTARRSSRQADIATAISNSRNLRRNREEHSSGEEDDFFADSDEESQENVPRKNKKIPRKESKGSKNDHNKRDRKESKGSKYGSVRSDEGDKICRNVVCLESDSESSISSVPDSTDNSRKRSKVSDKKNTKDCGINGKEGDKKLKDKNKQKLSDKIETKGDIKKDQKKELKGGIKAASFFLTKVSTYVRSDFCI